MKKADLESMINRLSELSLKELNDVQSATTARINEVQATEKEALNAKIEQQIKDAGFNVAEFLGKGGTPAQKTVKFQDPTNPNNTWGGRGKKPAWLTQKLSEGKSLDSFKIVPQGQQAA